MDESTNPTPSEEPAKVIFGPIQLPEGATFVVPTLPHRAPKPKPKPVEPTPPTSIETSSEPMPAPVNYGLSYAQKELEPWEEQLKNEAPDEEEERKTDPNIPHLYNPPFWSGKPVQHYTLELIKDGVSKGVIPLHQKSWYLFGRAPICDIELDHPVSY